jgi:hypothetical protein
VGDTFTFGVGTWNNTPTSYSLRLYRGTAGVITSETLVADAGNVTSSTYVIQSSDYTSTPTRLYFRAFATATNAAGTSGSGTYTGGQELGPITNTTSGGGTTTNSCTSADIANPSNPCSSLRGCITQATGSACTPGSYYCTSYDISNSASPAYYQCYNLTDCVTTGAAGNSCL